MDWFRQTVDEIRGKSDNESLRTQSLALPAKLFVLAQVIFVPIFITKEPEAIISQISVVCRTARAPPAYELAA